jgi:hypothetical protein
MGVHRLDWTIRRPRAGCQAAASLASAMRASPRLIYLTTCEIESIRICGVWATVGRRGGKLTE